MQLYLKVSMGFPFYFVIEKPRIKFDVNPSSLLCRIQGMLGKYFMHEHVYNISLTKRQSLYENSKNTLNFKSVDTV